MTRFALALIGLFALAACAAPQPSEPVPPEAPVIGMPNPASVHCERQGGRTDIRRSVSGGEYGVCVFPDGRQCEEWTLLRENRCVAPPAR